MSIILALWLSKAGVFKILGPPGQISKILSTKTQRAGSVASGSAPVLQMQTTATHTGSSLPRWALLLLQRQPKAPSTRCFALSDFVTELLSEFPICLKDATVQLLLGKVSPELEILCTSIVLRG